MLISILYIKSNTNKVAFSEAIIKLLNSRFITSTIIALRACNFKNDIERFFLNST